MPWGNFADNEVTWSALWSPSTNLVYVAIEVRDDIAGANDNDYDHLYRDDCIELFTDGDHNGGFYTNNNTKAQGWHIRRDNAIHVSFTSGRYTGTAITSAVKYGNNGNWVLELSMTIFDNFPSDIRPLSQGDIVGWDVWYDDSDNKTRYDGNWDRDRQVGWGYMGKAYINADAMQELLLGPEECNYLKVTYPNGGETWAVGTSKTITWDSRGTSGNVRIELSRNGGSTWETLFSSTSDDGAKLWTVTGPGSNNCVLKISDVDGYPSDVSDAPFTIDGGMISVISPNGGENWQKGTAQIIKWASSGTSGNVKIELTRNGGISWETLFASTLDDHSQPWMVTGPLSNNCKIRITDVDGSPSDLSDRTFNIVEEKLTVTSPNGGENWQIGTPHTIIWTSSGTSGNVKIELSRDGGLTWQTYFVSTLDDGSESWVVTGPASANCVIRISDVDGTPWDVSDSPFTISEERPQWKVPITVSGGGHTYTLAFGGDPTATDGFDSGMDEATAPPGMIYYAYFEIGVLPTYLKTDIRKWIAPYQSPIDWTLKIVNASGVTSTLVWNLIPLPSQGYFFLTGPELNINMRVQGSIQVSGNKTLTIQYRPLIPVSYYFSKAGWYLISLPVIPANNSLSALFPTAINAFGYNPNTGSYYTATSIEPKKGYWLLMPSAATVTVYGTLLTSYTEHYVSGWHLIGSVKGITDFTNPNDIPDGSVIGAYGWNAVTDQYIQVYPPGTGMLEEKQGYWLAVIQPCLLTIGGSASGMAKVAANVDVNSFSEQFGSQPPVPPFVTEQAASELLPITELTSRNYPNPFNPETVIEYSLPKAGLTRIYIYNALGQRIRTLLEKEQEQGVYQVIWNGRDDHGNQVTNGIYFYRIMNSGSMETKKMLMLK